MIIKMVGIIITAATFLYTLLIECYFSTRPDLCHRRTLPAADQIRP
jgi:hypothetical protein